MNAHMSPLFRAVCGLLVAFCLTSGVASAAPVPLDTGKTEKKITQRAFERWLQDFRRQAERDGISRDTLDRELKGLKLDRRVIVFDGRQFKKKDAGKKAKPQTFADYRRRSVSPQRIDNGRGHYDRLRPLLNGLETSYGVPGHIVIAFWGIETRYGAYKGKFDLISSLATLAFEGRRGDLFTRELLAALRLIDLGLAPRDLLVGSWAGGMGHPQFLPSSYLAFAVDHQGDGRRDIWTEEADSLASIANFLVEHGWQGGQPWVTPVHVPEQLGRASLALAEDAPVACPALRWRHSHTMPISQWRALGLTPVSGSWPEEDLYASLIEPDGPGTGGYLTYDNYRAIMSYNCTNFYALSIAHLAASLDRDSAVSGDVQPAGLRGKER